MPFGAVDPTLDLVALEERALARWRERDVVARVAASRKDAEPWIFYEGPPTANGRPGLHHVWARVFKDLYPRFQTMRGHDVPRKGGWDCHGLPVELEVERELGLQTKADIEAYGIEAFNQRCRESVQRYVEDWSSLTSAPAPGSTPRTPTGPCPTTTSSRSGGWCASSGTRACSTRATRSARTAPAVAPPSARTRWPRATRTSSTRRSTCGSPSPPAVPPTPTWWCGPPPPGR
jgi:hypothetical protein